MLKRTITYTDYDGNDRTEDFYFNLTKAELTEMNMSINGGMNAYINRIISAKDGAKIMSTFKELIMKSYGEKSLDGKRFMKSEELSIAFTQTEAYNILFMELVTDAEAGAKFIKAIIPKDLSTETPNE